MSKPNGEGSTQGIGDTPSETPTGFPEELPDPLTTKVEKVHKRKSTSCGRLLSWAVMYWVLTGLCGPTLILTIVATLGNKWFLDLEIAVADKELSTICEKVVDCSFYEAFSHMQNIAVILCSLACIMLVLSSFAPAKGASFTAKRLGMIGGTLMIAFAACQFTVLHLITKINREGFNGTRNEGPTYIIAMVGADLGVVIGVLLCLYREEGGDGPFCERLTSCRRPQKSTNGQQRVDSSTKTVPLTDETIVNGRPSRSSRDARV